MPGEISTPLLNMCNRLGIPNVATRKQNLQAAFASFVEDQYLFCLAAYDYMYAPTDLKWEGILHLFIAVKSHWELNIDANVRANIYRMTTTPDIKATLEGTTVPAEYKAPAGAGVRPGGVGNYNLCMKALNEAVGSARGMLESIQAGIRNGQGKNTGEMAVRMREAYTLLRRYWSEKEIITSFGLVVRQ